MEDNDESPIFSVDGTLNLPIDGRTMKTKCAICGSTWHIPIFCEAVLFYDDQYPANHSSAKNYQWWLKDNNNSIFIYDDDIFDENWELRKPVIAIQNKPIESGTKSWASIASPKPGQILPISNLRGIHCQLNYLCSCSSLI
jgi:hypothetical protein